MSEDEEPITPEHSELNRLISDIDIDHKLKSASQLGDIELVKELLCNGAQVITDEVKRKCSGHSLGHKIELNIFLQGGLERLQGQWQLAHPQT